MLVYLIRHGNTEWNVQGRYLGLTDMPLSDLGVETAKNTIAPEVDIIFCSPLTRCLQTADILFPGRERIVIDELHECDFGRLEGRSAEDMIDDEEYRRFVDEGCIGDIPGGENVMGFKNRVCTAFEQAVREHSDGGALAFVVHGGVIMALLERFNAIKRDFYEYSIDNCAVIACDCKLDGELFFDVIGGKYL